MMNLKTLRTVGLLCLLALGLAGAAGAQTIANPEAVPGCVLDLEATTGLYQDTAGTTPCTTTGQKVALWKDQSASGANFSQATAAAQETYTTGVSGGQPGVTCTYNQYLSLASASLAPGNSYTVFCVFRGGTGALMGKGDTNQFALDVSLAGAGAERYDTVAAGVTPSATAANVLSYDYTLVNGTPAMGTRQERLWLNGGVPSITRGQSLTLSANAWNVGGNNGVVWYTGNLQAVVIYTGVLSDANRHSVESYLAGLYGATLTAYGAAPESTTTQILVDGNSLSFGVGVTPTGTQNWPQQMLRILPGAPPRLYNWGITGQATITMTANAGTKVDPIIAAGGFAKQILIAWEMTNDLSGNQSASTTYSDMKTYCQARKTANPGVPIIVIGMLPRGTGFNGTYAAFEANRQAVETSLRADFNVPTSNPLIFKAASGVTYADYFVDVAADPNVGQPGQYADLRYYQTDLTHMTQLGYTVIAGDVAPAVNMIVNPVAATTTVIRRRIN